MQKEWRRIISLKQRRNSIMKLIEYLKLIPKGLPNIVEIVRGLINNVELKYDRLPEDIKDEIIRRRVICLSCPYNSINAKTSEEYFSLYREHYATEREDEHCIFCGCPIEVRTASLDCNCGAEEADLPPKWEKYDVKHIDNEEYIP